MKQTLDIIMWSSDDQLLYLDVENLKYFIHCHYVHDLLFLVTYFSLLEWFLYYLVFILILRVNVCLCLALWSILPWNKYGRPYQRSWQKYSYQIGLPPIFICKIFICFYVKCKTFNISKLQQTTSTKKLCNFSQTLFNEKMH